MKGFVMRVAVAIMLATSMGACSSTPTKESTGQYVDDSAITTKVKSAIVQDAGLKGFQIGVETYKGVVQLSGFVDTSQTKARAEQIASDVPGVRSVMNNLVIKPRT